MRTRSRTARIPGITKTHIRILVLTLFVGTFFIASPARAVPFELYDGSDKYLKGPGLFDGDTWACFWAVKDGDFCEETALDKDWAHFVGFDLNTFEFLGYSEYLARLDAYDVAAPVQRRIVNSLTAKFDFKDDDNGFWDFSEWATGAWYMEGGPDCTWAIGEIDSNSWTCDFGVPDFDASYYLGFGAVLATVRDFKIDYIKIYGDYTPIKEIPEPGTLALLGIGLLGLGIARRRQV